MMTSPLETHLRPTFFPSFLARPAKNQAHQPPGQKFRPHQPQAKGLATGSSFHLSPFRRLFVVIPKPNPLRSWKTRASLHHHPLELPVSHFEPCREFKNAETLRPTTSKSREVHQTLAPLSFLTPLLVRHRSSVQVNRSPPKRNRKPAAFSCCHLQTHR